MLKIYSGKDTFYQWDLDQKLIVEEPTATEVHFCNGREECSPVCEVYELDGQRVVNVPNILFTVPLTITAYLYDGCCTRHDVTFKVKRRSKPADYVYTETEVKRWEDFEKRLDELELGSRAIIDVDTLPEEDINTALLYRTADGVYWYDAGWHKVADGEDIGTALESKQDIVVFDGEYNAETNKVATVETVTRKVDEIIENSVVNADYEENNPESKSYIANRPFYEIDNPELAVDIRFSTECESIEFDEEFTLHLVSENAFTYEELVSASSPFYFEIKDTSDDTTQTFQVTPSYAIPEDVGCTILYDAPTTQLMTIVVQDHTIYNLGGITLPSNGVYFVTSTETTQRFERLYREGKGIKPIDDKYLDLENRSKIKEVESIAKGAQTALSYNNYRDMISLFNRANSKAIKIGQSIMIVTLNVPDLWVSAIAEKSVPYTYTSDEAFVEELKTNGSVQVGYYVLSALETQKVDLTEYVKNTDYATNEKYGLIKINYAAQSGLRITPQGLRTYCASLDDLKAKANGFQPIPPNMLDHAVKIGVTTNTQALTDEEKASAAKWLGVPNAYEGDMPEMLVDIPFDMNGASYDINPDEYVHLVSDKTFTKEELLSETSPFYFDVKDTANNTTQTFSMADARFLEIEGAWKIYKNYSSPICTIHAYVVYDHTKCTIGGWTPPSNGIYFVRCTYHNLRFDRLYREGKGVKPIDNKYLDLKNNATIKALMARIEALENK